MPLPQDEATPDGQAVTYPLLYKQLWMLQLPPLTPPWSILAFSVYMPHVLFTPVSRQPFPVAMERTPSFLESPHPANTNILSYCWQDGGMQVWRNCSRILMGASLTLNYTHPECGLVSWRCTTVRRQGGRIKSVRGRTFLYTVQVQAKQLWYSLL